MRIFANGGVLRGLSAVVLLVGGLSGCWSDGSAARERRCLDRAAHETALYLRAVDAAMPAAQRVAVEEWNGCDSADNGAALYVTAKPGLRRDDIRSRLEKAGWTPGVAVEAEKRCGGCEKSDLATRIGKRVVGVALYGGEARKPAEPGSGVMFVVHAADGCWDDDGYRCE